MKPSISLDVLANGFVIIGYFCSTLGADFIICILAIIKIGAAYVSIDAFAPKNRIKDIIDDAKPKLVITNKIYRNFLEEPEEKICLIKHIHLETISYPKENLQHSIASDLPIYMMYTSGSTGRPKGVVIPHEAVVNLVWVENTLKISEGNRVSQFSNIAFDGSTFEIWGALLNGATLYIIPTIVKNNHAALKEILDTNQIQYMFLPTSYLHQIIKSAPETLNSISNVLFGGEQVYK